MTLTPKPVSPSLAGRRPAESLLGIEYIRVKLGLYWGSIGVIEYTGVILEFVNSPGQSYRCLLHCRTLEFSGLLT